MDNVYLFNPENDLALAFGGENYTAPPFAARLRHDLRLLPVWIAPPGSLVLCDERAHRTWLAVMHRRFGIDVKAVSSQELSDLHDCRYQPWGWSLDIRKKLLDLGADADCLPSREYINKLRELSHRRTSIVIHRRLGEMIGHEFSPIPTEFTDFASVKRFALKHRNCYVKAPWSSSGRGIYRALDVEASDFEQWCEGTLKRQGSVLCEPALNSIMDFAVEFYCENGVTAARGYSVFNSDMHSQYSSGLVTDTAHLKSQISSLYHNIDVVTGALVRIINDLIAPYYSGWLGIDMLLYRDSKSNEVRLDPCVELNLRTTMGVLTSIIGERFIDSGSVGTFRILYNKDGFENIKKNLIVRNGKIKTGMFVLTPVDENSQYCACIDVSRR
jgi:hypothetical protein